MATPARNADRAVLPLGIVLAGAAMAAGMTLLGVAPWAHAEPSSSWVCDQLDAKGGADGVADLLLDMRLTIPAKEMTTFEIMDVVKGDIEQVCPRHLQAYRMWLDGWDGGKQGEYGTHQISYTREMG